MGGKQTPNTELCSIFFYRIRDLYLKKGGKILIVSPKSLQTSEQHAKFRLFSGFSEIEMWFFNNDIFKIPSICIKAINKETTILERLKIKTLDYDVKITPKSIEFQIIKNDVYVPCNYKYLERDKLANRLIPYSIMLEMLPLVKSKYKKRFYRGGINFPRNLFFIKILSQDQEISKISPSKSINSKKPWNFTPYKICDVESKYIFSCVKSTELIPFNIIATKDIFLPVERDMMYHPEQIKPKASNLFDELSQKYKKIQEKDKRHMLLYGKILMI